MELANILSELLRNQGKGTLGSKNPENFLTLLGACAFAPVGNRQYLSEILLALVRGYSQKLQMELSVL